MADTILRVKNLNVILNGEEVIKDLSFEVKKGEVLTVLGPNGAGKTVLLKVLLKLLPYKGEIIWEKGIKVGYVPQRVPFIKEIPLSVGDFLKLKKVKEGEREEILKSVGMKKDFLNKKIGELSSGEFQRILVAWSLISAPEVLLFDEPMSGIDIKGEETIYNLLIKLKKEKNLTTLMVTHELNVVYRFSDNVLCLSRKGFSCFGNPEEILNPESFKKIYGAEIKFYEHKS